MTADAVLRCLCGNILAVRHPSGWEIRHRGRRVVVPAIILLGCEDCGAELRPAAAPQPAQTGNMVYCA